MPDAEQRLRLWQNTMDHNCSLTPETSLPEIAKNYELSGGAITNVVRYGAIRALQKNTDAIAGADLIKGIAKELRKEGKTV